MEYELARKLAIDVGYALMPFCDRLNIAGSIRRGVRPNVKDIELICIPKTEPLTPFDPLGHRQNVAGFTTAINGQGAIIKGKTGIDARYCQFALPSGVCVDLFMPQAHDYFRQYAIRTGSARYSANVIAVSWRKKGWVGTSDGLRLEAECVERLSGGKKVWTCTSPQPVLPPVWGTEQEFFEWLGLTWIAPQLRSL